MGNKKALIDVVIITGGRFDMLSKCLDALYQEAQLTPLSIYIIDNASPAEERIPNSKLFEYQKEKDLTGGVIELRSRRLQQEVGFPEANNEGARMGRSPLIMFLNDDVELHAGAIEKVVSHFEEANIGIVGIKLIFPPDSSSPHRPAGKVQHVGIAINIKGEPIHPLVGWSPDHPKTKKTQDVYAVTGACLTIRRQLFQRLHGFDLLYGAGTYEDVDLCLRVRQSGSRILIDTNSTGYHYAGATQEKKRVNYPLQMNMMRWQAKWGATGQIFWTEADFW
jgi:O-antigen biosynthesis protein